MCDPSVTHNLPRSNFLFALHLQSCSRFSPNFKKENPLRCRMPHAPSHRTPLTIRDLSPFARSCSPSPITPLLFKSETTFRESCPSSPLTDRLSPPSAFEIHKSDGVIELHNYCSDVYPEGDARLALIVLLQELHHAKKGVDIVFGTRMKNYFAPPNVFKHVAVKHPDEFVDDAMYTVKKTLIHSKEQLDLVRDEIRVSSLFKHEKLLFA